MLEATLGYLTAQVHGNQFFSAAVLGGAALATLNYARQGAVRAVRAGIRRLTVSMTVHSEDAIYVPLSQWLAKHDFDVYAQQYRLRTVNASDTRRIYIDGDELVPANGVRQSEAVFGPGYGTYLFRHGGKWLRVNVSQEREAASQGSSNRAQTREFLTITYLGLSRELMTRIVNEAMAEAEKERQTTLRCMTAGMHGWASAGSLRRAGPEVCPVVLNGRLLEDIEEDITQFLAAREWYDARGIPWRRGYLLHGPPGTGKTSLCRYLARRFSLTVYQVDAEGYMSANFGQMLRDVQPRSLILFEDIDCHEISHRDKSPRAAAPVEANQLFQMNIGTLLNAIDGINPPEQVLVVMTSNNPHKLDPALVRPGRIDRWIELGNCTPDHATKLFDKFFPDASPSEVERFRTEVPAGAFSPAELQEIFIGAQGIEDTLHAVRFRQPAEVRHA